MRRGLKTAMKSLLFSTLLFMKHKILVENFSPICVFNSINRKQPFPLHDLLENFKYLIEEFSKRILCLFRCSEEVLEKGAYWLCSLCYL